MQNRDIYSDDFVSLEPVNHIYTDKLGNKYKSVTRILSLMQMPFDSENISLGMAKRNLGMMATPERVKQEQQKILKSWNEKKENSLNHGNSVHDSLEEYFLNGSCENKQVNSLGDKIFKDLFSGMNYQRFIAEKIYYDSNLRIAGSSDLSVVRKHNRSNPWIVDIYDYKTNIEQGIRFDSIDRRKSPPRHYEEYLLGDFSHVEACNYFKYAMQLSMYAYFAMKLYPVRIGRLAIIFINEYMEHIVYPVPFMYYEAEKLIEMHKNKKALPSSGEKDKPSSVKSFDIYNDDWF